jgi:hypothetical protein
MIACLRYNSQYGKQSRLSLARNMAHIGVQNGPYCEVKWLMLHGKMADIVTH